MDNNEVFLSGEEQVFAIAEAVEEVSVQTGNFGVEFGRAGGGVFNVVTKSGTNQLHGSLSESVFATVVGALTEVLNDQGIREDVLSALGNLSVRDTRVAPGLGAQSPRAVLAVQEIM